MVPVMRVEVPAPAVTAQVSVVTSGSGPQSSKVGPVTGGVVSVPVSVVPVSVPVSAPVSVVPVSASVSLSTSPEPVPVSTAVSAPVSLPPPLPLGAASSPQAASAERRKSEARALRVVDIMERLQQVTPRSASED
jgi:hypothetical protein